MANCGYRTGLIFDPSRSNWHNDGDRPIAWSAWYPTHEAGDIHTSDQSFFDLGDVIWEAALPAHKTFPVVLLSHGTGGTAESLGWLARALACNGAVVIGANHHGNTGVEPYVAEGFLCWWERATDLSVLLSSLSAEGSFADRLRTDQVSALGFSLGAYSVLALAGAKTSLTEFETWQRAHNIQERGPREFPDAMDKIPDLTKTSPAFRQAWQRHDQDFTDSRITSIAALAPPPPVRSFTPGSVASLDLPVAIITGGDDHEAPSNMCADWLVAQNGRFQRYDLGEKVGHYTFLEHPSDCALIGKTDIFTDHAAVRRQDVHKRTAEIVLAALS